MGRDLAQEVLSALYQAAGPLSGEELAGRLAVSRTAIWKVIGKLRQAGYKIDAAPNRGYALMGQVDIPYPEEVQRGLATEAFGRNLLYFRQLASTSDQLRGLAREEAAEGTVVIADAQLKGKGRWGRTWFATQGENLTFSILLRPTIEPRMAGLLAPLVGVACLKVLTGEPYGVACALKWPNDLMASGRKLGGILIELSAELERIHYVIVGLGLNVNCTFETAPSEVRERAASMRLVTGKTWRRVPLLQRLLAALEQEYRQFLAQGPGKLLESYRACCVTLGQEVAVYSRGELVAAGLAEDIDESCNLILRTESGLRTVTSGEVSLRKV